MIFGDGTIPPEYEAFRWTESGGMVGLGDLPGGDFFSYAIDVSADGSVIVGSGSSVNGNEAFRWTKSAGMVGLGQLSSGDFFSYANGVSADGSVIVGASYGVNGNEAFRWTESGGMVGLGGLRGGFDSYANDVSADGSVIVGYSNNANGNQEAFRWTQETGMVSLKETLIGKGLDVSGWTLSSAQAISADGFTIVGNGINPSGQTEAWMANLSPEPIPEPLTILGSMAAIAFGAGFERKFSKNKSDEKDPDA
jgi:probable HAF family extracellular repeat protein